MATVEQPFGTDRLNSADDFRPEWDVPTLGKTFTDALSAEIDSVRANPLPDPARRIHLFAGQAGYGKTHLFGRIQHQQTDRVQFVFVHPPRELTRVREYAAWPIAERLFASRDGFAPMRLHLARLLAPSFLAYFEQLPRASRAKLDTICRELARDALTVLELVGKVDDLEPYHRLADELRRSFPRVSGAILRAIILSLTPAGDDARWWLRGEGEQLPPASREALRLPAESPAAAEVVAGIAALLQPLGIPLVVCFDQLEALYDREAFPFAELTNALMDWLQTIPNLIITLGCFTDRWGQLKGQSSNHSFTQRVVVHELQPLTPEQTTELVHRRLQSWSGADRSKPFLWPFDPPSVRRAAESRPTHPRRLIIACREKMAEWQQGGRVGLIDLGDRPPPPPIHEWFLGEWARESEKVKADRPKPGDTQESELWAGVEGALAVARLGGVLPPESAIRVTATNPLNKVKADANPSCTLEVAQPGGTQTILVAVSKKDSGKPFGTWVDRLSDAMTGSTARAVFVRPREELTVGKTTAAYKKYAGVLDTGRLRAFPLDTHEATFHQLECLRRLVRAADGRMLLFGDRILTADECRKLVADTKVMANLKLFEFLFQNWPGTANTPSAPTAPPVPPPPPVSTAPPAIARTFDPVPPPSPPTPPVPPPPVEGSPWAAELLQKAAEYLKKRGQAVHPAGYIVGPTFARLKVELRGDADVSKIRKQAENLRTHLKLQDEPLIASQPGYVSIDVQRSDRATVFLPPLLPTCPTELAGEPAFLVGVDVDDRPEWLNLSEPSSCHLLVAGTTGSGKSEFLKAMLACLAARLTPEQVRFRLVDPKRVTFNLPNGSPYLGGPVVYDAEEALPVLEGCVAEMERRYKLMQQRGCDHVRHLTGADAVPRWVIVFDEFADLMTDKASKKELEPLLKRLGAKARAAGVHLVLATQRPEASVVTPLLRSNMPGRIGLMVSSERESKLFLDEPDAAYLFGKGDLVLRRGGGLTRLQSPFVPKAEFDRYLRTT